MSDILNRIARLVCLEICEINEPAKVKAFRWPDDINGDTYDRSMSRARAILKAMREPTQAMIEAGFARTADPCWPEDVGKAWRAMIDRALKEE